MAPINMLLRHVLANRTVSSGSTPHTGVHIQWAPLIALAIIVILIVGAIFIPKTWLITFYNRVRHSFGRTKKHPADPTAPEPVNPITTNISLPRRIFTPFSKSRRRDEGHRLREAREEPFIDVHLREIRGWKKPEVQSVNRPEPIGSEEVGLPLPVLHPDRSRDRKQRLPLRKTYASFKQWLKDEEAD
ncbi:uncharacterized protein N0V89_005326 [Didymosphaeria variabile]|uniref:Uncharacterized protein n=1 Tax=Didymosphaeria variabile TaxID=1932322 RepID=A0A9W8XKT9_9PLEO|nr:uncharacterized protein N0V89_005326 [Didymosphaeria variabile]KAJ4353596.1 hypothetical protein N0V89_005326 [Didymosphaeria variabile]